MREQEASRVTGPERAAGDRPVHLAGRIYPSERVQDLLEEPFSPFLPALPGEK